MLGLEPLGDQIRIDEIRALRPFRGAAEILAAYDDWGPLYDLDRLAFVGSMKPNDYYQLSRAMVVPASGGTPVDLTGALDAWVATDNVVTGSGAERLVWSKDDTELLVPLAPRAGVVDLRDRLAVLVVAVGVHRAERAGAAARGRSRTGCR